MTDELKMQGSLDEAHLDDQHETGQPPASTLELPEIETHLRSRSPSPSCTIATEFAITNQMSRLTFLRALSDSAHQIRADSTSLGQLNSDIAMLEEQWQRFTGEHDKLGASARRTLFTHPYMVERVFEQGFHLYRTAHSTLHNLKAQLQEKSIAQSLQAAGITRPVAQQRKLPEITIQPFSGAYPAWPAFRDLFKSLVVDNDQITDVEKMHYLKTSLRDSAAQLIATLPLQGDSFEPAWNMLTARFENKRLLVSAHLDRIIGDNSIIKCTAQDLNQLLNSLTESLNALQALDVHVEHWDPILVHIITRKLGRPLIEAWENKLGSSSALPTLEQLKTFLAGRARAQERLESTHQSTYASKTQSSSTSVQSSRVRPTSAAHTVVSSRPPLRHQYPCDMCGGEHYIVACSKFLELSTQLRKKAAVAHRLCFNCLGHHNSSACNSTKTCKTCGQKHHTMLHVAPSTQSTTAPTVSTQSKDRLKQ